MGSTGELGSGLGVKVKLESSLSTMGADLVSLGRVWTFDTLFNVIYKPSISTI